MRGTKQDFTGGAGPELPEGVYFVGRTGTASDGKEWKAPQIVYTREDQVPFMFKAWIEAVGGDGEKVTTAMYGRGGRFTAFIRPNMKEQGGPQNQEDYNLLSARLVSFITTVLSPGIEDEEAAWDYAYDQLGEYAGTVADTIKPEFFEVGEFRDNAAYIASIFASLLAESPRTVIVSIGRQARRDDPNKTETLIRGYRPGTVEEAARSGNLQIFANRNGVTEAEFTPSVATADAGEDF
jgi:hypothetical protein